MNKEEYEELKDSGDPAGALIESLAAVARAAEHLAARGYEKPNELWRRSTLEALDAVPQWALEASDG